MGEISDLIGIYGAIEAAVISDPERRAAVANVLPIYGDDSLGVADLAWFDEFVDWAKQKAGTDDSPIPSADVALRELATIVPVGRMRARRMLAIAALARADPRYADRSTTKGRLAQNALNFGGITNDNERVSLHRLLTDMSQDVALTADDWWENQVVPGAAPLIHEDQDKIGHRPCTAGLVPVTTTVSGHGSVLATALKTEFESVGIDFDRVIRFLDPSNWEHCNAFWCDMTLVPPPTATGTRHFHERVSLDCNDPHAWSIQAELNFSQRLLTDPRVAVSEYHLTPPHPLADDDVLVDAGVLIVEELEPPPVSRMRVTTTKRVCFTRNFPGPGLALFMCAVGYASIAEDFVYTCAIDPSNDGSNFDTRPEKAGPVGPRPPLEPVIKQFADEIATATKACIRDLAAMADETSQKIEHRSYGADDLVQDTAALWLKTFRESATAVDLGLRSAQAAAARKRRAPESHA
jgi:hypothetical protein